MPSLFKPVTVLLLVTMGVGAVHGLATDRWKTSRDLRDAVARLDRVPLQVGPWTGTPLKIEPEDLARAGIRGSVSRQYRHADGSSVTVLLVCGRGGPISVHTPDVCYAGAGYRMAGPQEKRSGEAAGQPFSYWTAVFAKPDAVIPVRSQLCWCWSRDGQSWDAPASPRWSYARYPAVYKLYVSVDASTGAGRSPTPDALTDFLPRFLTEVRSTLAPDSVGSPAQ